MSAGDTLSDLLGSAQKGIGQAKEGLRNMTARAADGFSNVMDKVKPAVGKATSAVADGMESMAGKLRGAPATPAAAPAAPAAAPGTAVVPWNPVTAQAPGPVAAPGVGATVQAAVDSTKPAPTGPIKSPLDPRFADPLADSNAKIRTMNNPVLDVDAVQQKIGAGNQRFDQFHPQQPTQTVEQIRQAAAKTATPQARAQYSGLDNTTGKGAAVARGAARLMAGAPIIMEGANVAQTAMNPNSTGEDVWREGARGLIRGGMGTIGAMGGAALGSLVTPVAGTVGGGVLGGGLGHEAGDYIANRLLGAPRDLRGAPVAPGMVNELAQKPAPQGTPGSDKPMTGSSSAAGGDVLNGRRLNWGDDEYVDGVRKNLGLRAQPTAQRDAPSHRGYYLKPGEDPNKLRDGYRDPRDAGWVKSMGDFGKGIARVRAAEAYEQGNINERKLGQRDRELGINEQKAGLEAVKYRDERRVKNTEQLRKTVDTYAGSVTPESKSDGMLPGGMKRADHIKLKGDQLMSDIEYSAKRAGRHVGDLTQADTQDLIDASKFKDRWGAKAKDYFGDTFDSRDLRSYVPASARQTATGRWEITMKSGNKAMVTEMAGGKFNWTGSNEPIDADLMERITPLMKKKG